MTPPDIFSLLITEAQSLSQNRAKVTAALVRRGRIIAIGRNSYSKSHPLQKRFGKNTEAIFAHAEIDALVKGIRSVGIDGLPKCDMFVARWKEGGIGLAKPCEGCSRALMQFGIRRVEWTVEE